MRIPSKFPVIVRTDSVIVKIYRQEREKGGQTYSTYIVNYRADGKRSLKTYADYGKAHREATGIAQKLAQGELDVIQLTGADRAAYGHALTELKPTGVALELAAKEYAAAQKILGGRTTLIEAAKFYLSRHKNCEPKDIAEAVEEMIQSKVKEGGKEAYIKALRCYLGKFSNTFHGPISSVSTQEIADFLRDMKVSSRSKKNCRAALSAFFKFCKERTWIAKDEDPLEHVPKFKGEIKDIEIYTPEELAKILSHARSELIPYLTIAAFAGLRSAELQRLDWEDIALEDGFITVDATKAKTGARRTVPISTNLKAWLMPYFRKEGRVVPFDNIPKQLGWLAEDAGLKWKKNALRHSFCSYRLSQTQDAPKVALEAGNSPQMIFRHYHQLVRPAEAKRWFAIETVMPAPNSGPKRPVPPRRPKIERVAANPGV